MDNATNGHHVIGYHRAANGPLTPAGVFETGGFGSGGGLGNQGAVILSRDGNWLFVCNAGSDEISVFGWHRPALVWPTKESPGESPPAAPPLRPNCPTFLNPARPWGDKVMF